MSGNAVETAMANAAKAGRALDAFDQIVEGYCKAGGIRLDKFGMDSVAQPDLIHNMRKGRDFRRSTIRKILQHIEDGGSQSA